MVNPHKLVEALRGQELRCRVGVLGLPAPALGSERQIAAALDVEFTDYRERLLASAPAGSRFLHLSAATLFDDLDRLANAASGESCVLVGNFDVAVGRLGTAERTGLWNTLLTGFPHRTRALILCVPMHEDARLIFPDSETRRLWQESLRYAKWPDGRGDGQQAC